MLFVQGSRDPFGTSTEITALLERLQSATVHEVAGGDHSFKVPGKKDVLNDIMDVVAAWVHRG
jgi:predicted alpha/beta-hydrolase family hydrolase